MKKPSLLSDPVRTFTAAALEIDKGSEKLRLGFQIRLVKQQLFFNSGNLGGMRKHAILSNCMSCKAS